jgi:hypothetical protein
MRGATVPQRTLLWQCVAVLTTIAGFFAQPAFTAAYTTTPFAPSTQICPLDTMDSLDSPFTIEINGSPISKTPENAEEPIQAKVGSDAAIFTLKNGLLQCGDWVLGRAVTENRSMLPKKVLWFKGSTSEGKVQPVTAKEDGGSHQVLFAGVPLTETDGAVFADLLQGMIFSHLYAYDG